MLELLNIENLARSLLETRAQATGKCGFIYTVEAADGSELDDPTWEQLDEAGRQILREQARLLLDRWMR